MIKSVAERAIHVKPPHLRILEASVDGRFAVWAACASANTVLNDLVTQTPDEGGLAGGAMCRAALGEFNIPEIHVLKPG
jgi:NADH dehydrogenase FAD-containing subunit